MFERILKEHLYPWVNSFVDLGSSLLRWRKIWTEDFDANGVVTISRTPVATTDAVNKAYADSLTPNPTVEEVDGAPSYTDSDTIRFDQADGFVLTQPGAGIVRVDLAAIPVALLSGSFADLGTTLTGTVAVADGGTALDSGTSGGVLGFTAAGTIASSIALTASAIVLGGGAGATPTPMGSLGSTTTVLHGNAGGNPSFGAVALGTDVSGTLPVANGGTGITSSLRFAPGGRLTLTTATPVMAANVAASTSIYYALYIHDQVLLYDGTNWVPTTFTELTNTTTDATKNPAAVGASSNYDLFVWNDAGTIRLGRGPAWSTDTTRGVGAGTTELVRVGGTWLNANAITNGPAAQRGTYVGSVRSNSGSTIDWHTGALAVGGTAATLYIWNMYHRVPASARVADSTDSWTYTSATWRAANASNAMRVSVIRGLNEDSVSGTYNSASANPATQDSSIGINLDATAGTPPIIGYLGALVAVQGFECTYTGLPGLGFHFLQAVEATRTAGAGVTFYGDAGIPDYLQGALQIRVLY